jgi:hypothetical protein
LEANTLSSVSATIRRTTHDKGYFEALRAIFVVVLEQRIIAELRFSGAEKAAFPIAAARFNRPSGAVIRAAKTFRSSIAARQDPLRNDAGVR